MSGLTPRSEPNRLSTAGCVLRACYGWENRRPVIARVRQIGVRLAYEEFTDLQDVWSCDGDQCEELRAETLRQPQVQPVGGNH